MYYNDDKIRNTNARRTVLIADDELINRELLSAALEGEYDVLTAEDGKIALDKIYETQTRLSLILLDLMMPNISGIELLKLLKADSSLARIPVIVLTADQQAEVECLSLGAADFIPKPYPQRDIIIARVKRTIELSEDRQTIQATERDALTGLYNREFFYNYARQFDRLNDQKPMDAIVIDINHFHVINERYGRQYADRVLSGIGSKLNAYADKTGALCCRSEADTFLIYSPNSEDYAELFESISLSNDIEDSGRVRLRMGVYAMADMGIDVERRFDRAKTAADTIRNNYAKNIAVYDEKLHESEMYSERLSEDFEAALSQKQFVVFYQPKYDISGDTPRLASAEALVRWIHPELGMISPGMFIPLMEQNGLIRQLDRYVWREAAMQIRKWKDRLGRTIPVSVNVSRVDILDEELVAVLNSIVAECGLNPKELILEVTESAYTDDAELIINKVRALRELGFKIEMDDFGTGYSSLGMISQLPMDALKLDMIFVRTAFGERRDTRLINLIIDIADYLHVPVIAEGVETREQVRALKDLGCAIVQGYYFSKPLPASEFEKLPEVMTDDSISRELIQGEGDYMQIAKRLLNDYESLYVVDMLSNAYAVLGGQDVNERLNIETRGISFFEECAQNMANVIYTDDRDRMIKSLQKQHIIDALNESDRFDLSYRMMFDGMPLYYRLSAFYPKGDQGRHLIVGVRCVENELSAKDSLSQAGERSVTFARIAQALSQDFFTVYYINTRTNSYIEYAMNAQDHRLTLVTKGNEFFEDCAAQIPERILSEDRDRVSQAFEKDALLNAVANGNTFSINYSVLVDGEPMHVSVKAMRLADDAEHMVIGMRNIDSLVKQQREYEAARQNSITYSRIAQALANDYFSIYYVNLDDDSFIEFSAHESYNELGIEKSGSDFFNLSRKNVLRVMYKDDQANFFKQFTKENILKELDANGTFTITYRLMFDGVPTYVGMKATRMLGEGGNHIVIGVNNIHSEMQRRQESLTYSRIAQALSADYFSIYLVNTDTDSFIEYSSSADFRDLNVEQSGSDFFEDCRRNIMRLVHPDDMEKALSVWEKQRLLPVVEKEGIFSTTYRLMMDGAPVYINCKVVRISGDAEQGKFIVIGVSNVDAQMKREQSYAQALSNARELAARDALTGVKSKHAFVEAVSAIDEQIKSGEAAGIAVSVCDVNDLKKVNDTEGHAAGDRFVKDAAMIICNIFKHSPVFRIGGDEFAVIMRGQDYENRKQLISTLRDLSNEHKQSSGIVIACGASDYINGKDEQFQQAFDRADQEMYEDKRRLKGIRE